MPPLISFVQRSVASGWPAERQREELDRFLRFHVPQGEEIQLALTECISTPSSPEGEARTMEAVAEQLATLMPRVSHIIRMWLGMALLNRSSHLGDHQLAERASVWLVRAQRLVPTGARPIAGLKASLAVATLRALANRVVRGEMTLRVAQRQAKQLGQDHGQETLGAQTSYLEQLEGRDPHTAEVMALLLAETVGGMTKWKGLVPELHLVAARMAKAEGRLADAMAHSQRAILRWRQTGEFVALGAAIQFRGEIACEMGEWGEVVAAAASLVGDLPNEIRDKYAIGACQLLIRVGQALGNPDLLLAPLQSVVPLLRDRADATVQLSGALRVVSEILQRQGRYTPALVASEEAITVLRTLSFPDVLAMSLQSSSSLCAFVGDPARALERAQEAYALFGSYDLDPILGASVAGTIASVYLILNRVDEANAWFRTTYQLCEENQLPGVATILLGLAQTSATPDEQWRFLVRAMREVRRSKDRAVRAQAREAVGQWYGSNRANLAQRYFEQALRYWTESGDAEGVARSSRHLGELLWETKPGQALTCLEQALGWYEQVGNRDLEAEVRETLGRIYRDQLGNSGLARQYFEYARGLFQAVGNRVGEAGVCTEMGLLEERNGNPKEAYHYYEAALNAIEEIRTLQQQRSTRKWVIRTYAKWYRSMVRLCLSQDWLPEAWHWLERSKARVLMDVFDSARPRLGGPEQERLFDEWRKAERQLSTLENDLRQGASSAPRPDRTEQLTLLRAKESEARERLLASSAAGRNLVGVDIPAPMDLALLLREFAGEGRRPLLVQFVLLEANEAVVLLLPVWRVEKEERLPLSRVNLQGVDLPRLQELFAQGLNAARTGEIRGTAGAPDQTRPVVPGAIESLNDLTQELGRQLVEPWFALVQNWEEQPTELIIVPHRELNLYPLHASRLSDGRPLLEHLPAFYLPNATMAKLLLERRGIQTASDWALLGPPGPGLRAARQEILWLERQTGFAPKQFDQMRRAELQGRSGQLAVAHLATHSTFHLQDYLRSSIEFGDGSLTLLDLLEDTSFDFSGMKLFYLSSCESALLLPEAGDEQQGFPWAAMYAGAQAVVATLWPVHDPSALKVAKEFYRNWLDGKTLVDSLHAAVIGLKERGDGVDPFYWAPFLLFGDGYGAYTR